MASIDFAPKLSPRFAVYMRDFLLDRDIDPRMVFLECGIDQVTESESAIPIATSKVLELFDVAADVTADPLLGHNMALNYHYENSAVIILAMLAAPSVSSALETLVTFDKYVDSGIEVSFDCSGEIALFTSHLLGLDGEKATHLNEYLITFIVAILNKATRKNIPLRAIHFQHSRELERSKLQQFFMSEVHYNMPTNAILFDSVYLDEHLNTSNALLYEILQGALKTFFGSDTREHRLIDAICRELMHQSEIETTDIQFVADALSISARTLSRRIKEEGFTFQKIKNLARERQSKYYLRNTNMSLSEIAYELGYAELSSFSRAFKRWTGESPQQFRVAARRLISA